MQWIFVFLFPTFPLREKICFIENLKIIQTIFFQYIDCKPVANITAKQHSIRVQFRYEKKKLLSKCDFGLERRNNLL